MVNTESVRYAELFDNCYTVHQKDRSNEKTRGGGVLVAIKKMYD